MIIGHLLREDSKAWWYHQRLRQSGNRASLLDAMERERRSVRSAVRNFRDCLNAGGYLSIGRGGWTLHVDGRTTVAHYGGMETYMAQCCLRLGIPIIDSTVISDKDIYDVIKFPMVGIHAVDLEPYNSMSFAPLATVAKLYRDKGAKVYNLAV